MSNTAVLITDMSILVGIFLLGLLAKLFPKRRGPREQGNAGTRRHGVGARD